MARTHAPAPGRFNALFIAPGFGTLAVPVERVMHGLQIVSRGDHSRAKQTQYTTRVKTSSFALRLHFADRGEYVSTTFWLTLYAAQLISPASNTLPIRVVVPSVRFDKTGIPNGAIPFGDRYDDVSYRLDLEFEGTSSPVTAGANPGSGWWSRFSLPDVGRQVSEHFYPGGIQLGGDYGDEDALYAPQYGPLSGVPGSEGGSDGGGGGGGRRFL